MDSGNGKFNLIVLCWNEGQQSRIHDHAKAHCFAKVLEGSLDEVMFDWPEEEGKQVTQRETYHHKANQVTYISGRPMYVHMYVCT